MANFTYNDIVRVTHMADGQAQSMPKAWIVGIYETDKELGPYWKKFPPGVVYTIEFEDGSSTEVHENELLAWRESVSGQ